MEKVKLMNNTKTRRKGSMLQDNLSKIKYFLLLAILLILPLQANAGTYPIIDQTDSGSNRLVAYWDTQGRDSFIQVTNTSSSSVTIHVQVFDVSSPFTTCEECNFDDSLTPNDTHVYDIENLITNDMGDPVCTELGPGGHGMMVISAYNLGNDNNNALIGMFRIIDEAGYEYRTNASSAEDYYSNYADHGLVNFSTANGNNMSDLVGLAYEDLENDGFSVFASPVTVANFGSPENEILIWDSDEDDISCSPTYFACGYTLNGSSAMNRGVDNALPNSHGDLNRVCASSILDSNSSGWLDLPFTGFSGGADHFVGYIGLNNGDGTGSMDSWWAIELYGNGQAMKVE